MVEGGMCSVKILLFIFNFVFFLAGAALLGVGIYVQVQLNEYFDFFNNSAVNAPAIVIIAVGALVLILGFLGCCGAIKEHYCMLMTFAVLIGIILIIQIAGGIAGFVMRGKVEDIIRQGMQDSMENYNESEGVKNTWDAFQKKFKCCGTSDSTDWNGTIPGSCCVDQATCQTTPKYFSKGCLSAMEEFLMSNIAYVAGAAVGLAVIELLGIILACCLARSVKNQYSYA